MGIIPVAVSRSSALAGATKATGSPDGVATVEAQSPAGVGGAVAVFGRSERCWVVRLVRNGGGVHQPPSCHDGQARASQAMTCSSWGHSGVAACCRRIGTGNRMGMRVAQETGLGSVSHWITARVTNSASDSLGAIPTTGPPAPTRDAGSTDHQPMARVTGSYQGPFGIGEGFHPGFWTPPPPKRWITTHTPWNYSSSVLSLWFALFRNRLRPMIGMLTHSQHSRRDWLLRHKGIDVSQSRCIMVSSRKTPPVRSAVPTGPGQGSCCRSRPLAGDGGTRSGTEEVAVGGGPVGGVRSGIFRVLGPPGAARRDGRHVPGIYNESRNQHPPGPRWTSPRQSCQAIPPTGDIVVRRCGSSD